MSLNRVMLIGNVGQDPKVTYFDSGNCVAQCSLATTDRAYTMQNGTQVPERTEWHNLIFRGRTAETVEKYVHKGDKLYVDGKIRTRSYDDQGGIKRYITEIFVDNMEMLTPKASNPGMAPAPQPDYGVQPQQTVQQATQPQPSAQPQQPVQPQPTVVQDNPTDDLPF